MEASRQKSETLFERLGGKEGIHALVDDIVDAHMENPLIRARFLPYAEDPEHLAEIKEHTRRFLAMGSGGPDAYQGRTMSEAHRGMNISEEEYMAAVDDIMGVLQHHQVGEESQKDVLMITYSLRSQIMGK
jgi:hemoglobin